MKLGELEKQLLKYFWQFSNGDVKKVYQYFSPRRGGSLNTIQSTLDRLFKKGLLHRDKVGHAFVYRAALAQHEFIGQLIKDVTADFIDEQQDGLAAAFVSLSTQFDDQQLVELEQMIKQHRQRGNQ